MDSKIQSQKDEPQQQQAPKSSLLIDKHKAYVKSLEKENKDSFEYWATEHLRMSGIYWGLTALDVMNDFTADNEAEREKTIQFVLSCQHPSGGFGGNPNHDPHLLYTLSAVQILTMFNAIDRIDSDKVAKWVAKLQNTDGSFCGDEWGEVDTRFSYCAISCLALLGKLGYIECQDAVNFIMKCKNFDEAFGVIPGAESHAGQTFCCVGALTILQCLDYYVDRDMLGWWLCERQVKEGGLNGRPEKTPDVCYSWWVLSSLAMIDRLHWIDKEKLVSWILNCQDEETGGFSDKPGNLVDVYHTCFAITGLSLLGHPNLSQVDPRFCMTVRSLHNAKLKPPPKIRNPKEPRSKIDNPLTLGPKLYRYLLDVSSKEPEILARLRQETTTKFGFLAQMMIPPDQGQFLSFLVRLINAKKCLEVGVFTGYSSIWVALSLPDNGKLIACDIDPVFTSIAQKYWKEAGVSHKIELHLGDALETLNKLIESGHQNSFDFAFIDADKQNMMNYYEKCLALVRVGGVIAIDNVLWGGRVADPEDQTQRTNLIRQVNEKVRNDSRVYNVMLGIGDGLTLVIKLH